MFTNSTEQHNSSTFSVPKSNIPRKSNQPLRSCLKLNGVNGQVNTSESDPDDPGNPPSGLGDQMKKLHIDEELHPISSLKDEKKVVFADSKGLPLVRVKLLDSPSSSSDKLYEDLLKDIVQDAKPEPDHPYTYVVDFEQPAVQYLQFRERIEHKCVSLENVMIRDNIKVLGTAKVKNIAFRKSVTIRVTFDKWRTFKDIVATFVPRPSDYASRYDAFSFEFDIPPNQGGKELEFCVHYETPDIGGSFWDSNNGSNYRIVSQERREMTQQQLASYYQLDGHHSWGDFSYWKTAEEENPPETPYW